MPVMNVDTEIVNMFDSSTSDGVINNFSSKSRSYYDQFLKTKFPSLTERQIASFYGRKDEIYRNLAK